MAAVVNFAFRDSTTSSTWTSLSGSIRFRNADSNDQTATTSPLVRPSSGTNYSYWKNLRCLVATNPATALLNLRVKCSVNTITLSSSDSACDLYYAFRVATDVPSNTATILSGAVGELTTSEVDWVYGRLAGNTTGGTAVANHVTGTHAAGGFWAGGNSDQLLLNVAVGAANTNGGSLDAFNIVMVYSEI